MSICVYILCQSEKAIPSSDVIESIQKESPFQSATIVVEDPNQSGLSSWNSIKVFADNKTRPIVISHYYADDAINQIVNDVLEDFSDSNQVTSQLIQEIKATKRILVVDIDPQKISQEAWDAVDCVEAYLAFAYSGLVYVAGEGLYNEGLELICAV